MLAQLSAQDAIIAAKTEQSYHVNQHRKEDPDIKVADMVAISNESQLQHLPKGRQKLATKWVARYKVLKVDKETSNYTIEIPNSKRHPTFYISYVKPYTDPQLDLFPNRQRRQPRIVNTELDLNLEVQKVIGHQRRRDGSIHLLSLWDGFPAEDATYRHSELFKTSEYGIKVVEDYLGTFGDLPDELAEWTKRTDRAKLLKQRLPRQRLWLRRILGVASGASGDKEDSGEEDSEEVSALWVKLELGDVIEDDFDDLTHGPKWGGCRDGDLLFFHLALFSKFT